MKNISASCYNDDHLFINYPLRLKPPSGDNNKVLNLVEILKSNFKSFKQDSSIKQLSSLPCIPVHAELDLCDESQVALVKSNCVVASIEEVRNYHPYLNALPAALQSIVGLLQDIGIGYKITFRHIQVVLEKVYLKSEGHPISVNAEKIVQLSIKWLHNRLHILKNADLSPLYLPDTKNIMRLSTSFIYVDDINNFNDLDLNFKDSQWFHLHLSFEKYGIMTSEFGNKLPSSVRPHKLSDYSILVPDKSCESVSHSEVAQMFHETFQDPSCSLNLAKLISHSMAEQTLEDPIAQEIKRIFESMVITTMKNLKTQVKLKYSGKIIGEKKSEYEFDSAGYHLYIDSEGNQMTGERIAYKIAIFILEAITLHNTSINHSAITKQNLVQSISEFLRISPCEKMRMLKKFQIDWVANDDASCTDLRKLGEEIPDIFHDRLDQHVDNIYNPMELVGYEVEDNKLILAKVIYLKRQEDQCSVYNKVYKIYVSDSDSINSLRVIKKHM